MTVIYLCSLPAWIYTASLYPGAVCKFSTIIYCYGLKQLIEDISQLSFKLIQSFNNGFRCLIRLLLYNNVSGLSFNYRKKCASFFPLSAV